MLANWEDSMAKLSKLLEDHPCLWNDLQIFIRNTGEIVHFDLDRCFQKDANQSTSVQSRDRLSSFAQFIRQALRDGVLPKLVDNDEAANKMLREHRQGVEDAKYYDPTLPEGPIVHRSS